MSRSRIIAAALSTLLLPLAAFTATPAMATAHPVVQAPAMVPGSAEASLPVHAGAQLGITEYQAEDAATNGTVIGPSTAFGNIASEASGREAVTLSHTGQWLEFTLAKPANAMDLRYSIPDTADGAGQDASLGMSVDGRPVAPLELTSRYSHIYGAYPFTNNPADGGQQHYFDDIRTVFPHILPAGSVVRLQVGPHDDAGSYTIDLADFARVAPNTRPVGSLSVTDFGAVPSDTTDSTAAIQAAIDAGQAEGKTVWIPAGRYLVSGQLSVDDVTVTGAGSWYSILDGPGIGVFGDSGASVSTDVHLADFAIVGQTDHRDDNSVDSGIGGSFTDSTATGLLIQHVKAGIWIGNSQDFDVRNTVIEDTFADGVNFAGGVTDSSVTNSLVRTTGDDGLAAWSTTTADQRDRFVDNTVTDPVLANDIAIYGGADNTVTGNLTADTLTQGGGIHIGNRFSAVPLSGTTTVSNNLVIRAGSLVPNAPTEIAAIWLWGQDSPITAPVDLTRNVVLDSPWSAFQVNGEADHVMVDGLVINRAGAFAVQLQGPGSGTFRNVVATHLGAAGRYDCDSGFTVVDAGGNTGWRTTRCGFPPNDTLNLSTSTLDFGFAALGTTASQSVTVTNTGPDPQTIGTPRIAAGYTATTDCGTLAAGRSCTIAVTFSPQTAANFAGSLSIPSTSPAGAYTVSLAGVGYDPNGDLALGRPVTSSSDAPGFPASQAVDGNPDSYWESLDGTFPQSIIIDLGNPLSIDRVTLQLPSNWGARTETVETQTSTDDSTFTEVAQSADYTLDPTTGNTATISLPATTARYVKLTITGNTGWDAAQFSEIGVWAH